MTDEASSSKQAQPSRRGRGPSLAKTAETKTKIAQAAFKLFLEGGFEGTRMIDVAQAADVGKGTLYRYYPTKEALFEGVLQETLGRTVQTLENPELRSWRAHRRFFAPRYSPANDRFAEILPG